MEDSSHTSLYSLVKNTLWTTFNKSEKADKKPEEIDLANNLEEYFNTTIREVMVPRTKMITIDKKQPLKDAVRLIHETGHSRIPVEDKKRDNIVGVLYAIDLFRFFETAMDAPVSDVMRKPYFVSYSQQIHRLLTNFKKDRILLAIVVDEHGGVDGLATIEDVVEQLVGDIPDEFNKDNEPGYQKVDTGVVLMDADYPLSDFNEIYETEFQKEGIETIGGYICHSAGKIPEMGEKLDLEGIHFEVRESNERSLSKLKVEILDVEEDS